MPNWRVLVVAVVLLTGLPTLAGAQGFKWWQSERFKTDLALTPDQSTRLEEIFLGLLPRITTSKEDLDRLEARLSDVISQGTASEADVMKLVDQVETARSDLSKTRTLMIYRMHRLLTPDQRVKMKALHDRWEQERRQGRRQPGR